MAAHASMCVFSIGLDEFAGRLLDKEFVEIFVGFHCQKKCFLIDLNIPVAAHNATAGRPNLGALHYELSSETTLLPAP